MKPTIKEIEFFCHPDQAWLQEEWKPAVGDWYATGGGAAMWLIVEVRDWGVFAKASHHHDMRSFERFLIPDEGCVWLPTLSDLLEMLDEYACSYALHSPDEKRMEYVFAPYNHDPVANRSVVIAAAKLLRGLQDE